MNINELKNQLNSLGYYNLERIYHSFSPNFSVLHQRACKDHLIDLTYHEFYCDMKRLEELKIGECAIAIYDPYMGWQTEIKTRFDIQNLVYDNILVFEVLNHETINSWSVPTGNVYKIVEK